MNLLSFLFFKNSEHICFAKVSAFNDYTSGKLVRYMYMGKIMYMHTLKFFPIMSCMFKRLSSPRAKMS